MKRVIATVVLIIGAAFGLLWPVFAQVSQMTDSSGAIYDPVTFTSYRADLRFDADGTLTARETIVGEFPIQRHGIFRFWDRRDSANPHNRYTPTITSITEDGRPATYEVLEQGGGRYVVAKIGDPNVYLSVGEHTYVIDYTIPGAISPGTAGVGAYATNVGDVAPQAPSAIYWNVVAPGWLNDIRDAQITMTLPSPALGVQCTAGVDEGARVGRGPCTVNGDGTTTVTLGAADIPPISGMTARVPMAITPPPQTSVPWSVLFDDVLGTSVAPVVVVGLLTVLLLAAGVAWSRSTHESEPGFPVMYAPPEGMSPAQLVYLTDEDTGKHALVATILYLADRGLVTLEHRSDDTWLVTSTGTPEQWAQIDAVSRSVASSLGAQQPGYWFLADGSVSAGKTLLEAQKTVSTSASNWATNTGLSATDPRARTGCLLWGLALVAAVIGFTGWLWPTMWGLPAAAFVIGAVALLSTKAAKRRTATGRRAWSEAGGFRRMLSTPSSEQRFDFAARKDMFIHYVPFAVAYGVADRWAEKYRVETNQEPPIPMWYPMAYGTSHSLYSGGSGFDSFESSVSSAIGAYQATQSSSSGGGGGGSFGGGGGGGGGGSW